MIVVTRLTGQRFAVNPDLLGRVEATPDTILVMLDGTRYLVEESMNDVVELIRSYRASVVTESLMTPTGSTGPSGPSGSSGLSGTSSGTSSRGPARPAAAAGQSSSTVIPLHGQVT